MRLPVGGLLLSLAAFLLLISVVAAWRVDCRKFVFAPRCRGVSAKRSNLELPGDIADNTADSERELANSFSSDGEDADDDSTGSLPAKNHVRALYDLSRLERQLAEDKAQWDRRNRLAEVLRKMVSKFQDGTQ